MILPFLKHFKGLFHKTFCSLDSSCFFPACSFCFFNYILLIMLLQLSQFFPLYRLHPAPCTPLGNPPHHCSCPWVMHISALATPFPILYFASPWLFCNYLFVLLNPLTSSPIPQHPPSHLTTVKMLSVSMILFLFLFA